MRPIVFLSTATVLAQIIQLSLLPILTNLYNPDKFGEYYTFLSWSIIAASVMTGKLELTIFNQRTGKLAKKSAMISLIVAAISSIILLAIFEFLLLLQNAEAVSLDITKDILLIPILAFMISAGGVNYTLMNYNKMYKNMSFYRFFNNIFPSLQQLIFFNSGMGLFVAHMFAQTIILSFSFCGWLFGQRYQIVRACRFQNMKRFIKENRKHIIFLTPGQLINSLSFNGPIVLIGFFYGPLEAGMFAMTNRILQAPTAIIASAVGDIFRKEAAISINANRNCVPIFRKYLFALILLGIIGFATFYLILEPIIIPMFGESWVGMSAYVDFLIVSAFFRFITAPLASLFYLYGKQRIDLQWQIINLTAIVLSLYIGTIVGGMEKSLLLYAIVVILMNCINLILTFNFARERLLHS